MYLIEEILERLTIKDVLVAAGLRPSSSRMPCPIHDGDNPTSFSFREHVFCCHACGANGGLLDLTMYLRGGSKSEAVEWLCDLAGLPRPKGGESDRTPLRIPPTRLRLPDRVVTELKGKIEWKKLAQDGHLLCLRLARRALKDGRMSLAAFYATEQKHLYQLEESDKQLSMLTSKLHQRQKELSRDARDNSKGCRGGIGDQVHLGSPCPTA